MNPEEQPGIQGQVNALLREDGFIYLRPFKDWDEIFYDLMRDLEHYGLSLEDVTEPTAKEGVLRIPLIWVERPAPEVKKAMPRPVLHVDWRTADDGLLVKAYIKGPPKEARA